MAESGRRFIPVPFFDEFADLQALLKELVQQIVIAPGFLRQVTGAGRGKCPGRARSCRRLTEPLWAVDAPLP
jgi:hypothetical protein